VRGGDRSCFILRLCLGSAKHCVRNWYASLSVDLKSHIKHRKGDPHILLNVAFSLRFRNSYLYVIRERSPNVDLC
jgi:hypothetical protein